MRNGKNILRMQADEEDVYHLMDLRERYFLMIGFGSFIEGIAVYFLLFKIRCWDHIRQEEMVKGVKTATLKFEVGEDFNKGDCRKCPLSYIAKENNENVYECPLKMRANCKLEIS